MSITPGMPPGDLSTKTFCTCTFVHDSLLEISLEMLSETLLWIPTTVLSNLPQEFNLEVSSERFTQQSSGGFIQNVPLI